MHPPPWIQSLVAYLDKAVSQHTTLWGGVLFLFRIYGQQWGSTKLGVAIYNGTRKPDDLV